MSDHTSYRIICRNGEASCETIPRLDRRRARQAAEDHAETTGHLCEVVKVQFTSIELVYPSASAIGGAK